ncbi:MAG: hypothetical protein M3Y06_06755, partial [Actinomycetota bacterium]|nr:hypothetical protein [Actinomycetota bacterium]
MAREPEAARGTARHESVTLMVDRMLGKQEVAGSIPAGSTGCGSAWKIRAFEHYWLPLATSGLLLMEA